MADRRRSRRRRRLKKITGLHYFNVMLYVVILITILLSVKMLGDGTASCFFEVATPPQ